MLGSKNWIVSLECKREMKRKSESNDAHTVYQLGDEKQTICVVYMKCSQHRLNANKHLIRFGAVVSVLCCARLCLDRALTHSFTRRLCVCVCALHSFVVHSFSVAFNAVLVAFDIAIYTYHVWDQAMCVRLPLLYTFSLVVLCRSGCGCWYVRVFRVSVFACVRSFLSHLSYRFHMFRIRNYLFAKIMFVRSNANARYDVLFNIVFWLERLCVVLLESCKRKNPYVLPSDSIPIEPTQWKKDNLNLNKPGIVTTITSSSIGNELYIVIYDTQ